MDRTSAAGWTDIGGGRRGYRNRNLGSGISGTALVAEDRNAKQEEIVGFIEASGLVPSDADFGQLWKAANAAFRPQRQIFTASGSFTVPVGVTRVKVSCWGGGGGGGGASTNGAGTGGSAGGFTTKVVTGLTPGATVTVTIGAGGAGGTSGGGNGGNGGTTSFGAHCSATGGSGNLGGPGTVPSAPAGAAGAGAGGDLNLSGQPPSLGVVIGSQYFGGQGGAAPFGGGSTHSLGTGGNANPGNFPGGGGAAAASNSGSFSGGAGAAGLVIVEW
jgi:hypothetical protein